MFDLILISLLFFQKHGTTQMHQQWEKDNQLQ